MNKLFLIGGVLLLITFTSSYFIVSNIYAKDTITDLDGNFKKVLSEVESYGGAMIVSYDTETGEITGKRRAYEPPKEAGVMTITEEEYLNSNNKYPEGTIVIPNDASPHEVINYITRDEAEW